MWRRLLGFGPTGTWETLELSGHLIEVYTPPTIHSLEPALLYLHDLDGDMPLKQTALTQQLAKAGLRVIAPHGGACWWTDRICNEFDDSVSAEEYLLSTVLDYAQEQWGIRSPRIGLLGLGMGGQGALRLAFKYASRFPVVAAVRPFIDHYRRWEEFPPLAQMYRDPEQVRQHSATLYVHPLNPPSQIWFCCAPNEELDWFESADRLQMKLASSSVRHQCDLETPIQDLPSYCTQQLINGVNFAVQALETQAHKLDVIQKP